MARKFLYFIAFCIVLVIGGRIVYELFQKELAAAALVPSAEFAPVDPLAANAYQDPALWYSRPGIGQSDPARWQPTFAEGAGGLSDDAARQEPVAVFFVHPTSYLNRSRWNAPIENGGDPEAERVARIFLRGMASAFNPASQIWAPRYRQATFGAFLTDQPEGQQAIDAAYADVLEAYRFFLASIDPDTPIVLAGHSQGSLHLRRLLAEEVRESPIAERLVAAYVIGWPISAQHDLPAMGLPACAASDQSGCLISWLSFAEPADPASLLDVYASSTALDGQQPGTSPIVCSNPLTGEVGGSAPASANLGTLVPDESIQKGNVVPNLVPARCDNRGLLLIGPPPEMGPYVLPGNNFHVYDMPLFWANIRADMVRRTAAWQAR
jgi:Protein of unknown function (DUF3089)